MWTSMRRSVKWKIGRASSEPLVMRHFFVSGEVFFRRSRLFVLFHPTQPHPSKPHQIKQPLSKIAVNERAVMVAAFSVMVAAFSLKYLPISEIKLVPLFIGMKVFVICFVHYKFTKILPYRQASIPFYFRCLRRIY